MRGPEVRFRERRSRAIAAPTRHTGPSSQQAYSQAIKAAKPQKFTQPAESNGCYEPVNLSHFTVTDMSQIKDLRPPETPKVDKDSHSLRLLRFLSELCRIDANRVLGAPG